VKVKRQVLESGKGIMEKNILKNKKRNNSNLFLILFGIMFVVLVGGAFMSRGGLNTAVDVVSNEPVELTFSDVLRRADEIKTMKIRDNVATGQLRDGTKYNAVITYNPELLEKLSNGGTVVSIDTSKGWVDYLGTWVPILMGLFFIWWIFRGMRGGAGGLGRALLGQNPTKIVTGKPKTTFKDVVGIDSEKQELS
jgi:ATP-dependent Zn protease